MRGCSETSGVGVTPGPAPADAMEFNTTMFEVRQSPIHGRGLFATTFIPADTVIGRIEGVPAREDGPYVLWIDGRRGLEVTNEMRYINHAAEPNAAYFDDLTVMALCDIYPGDEITHDYDGDGQLGQDEAEFEAMA
jgi:SET domain-containing protein